MSNLAYSKAEVIISAVRELLLGDNAATGNTVGSINSYVVDRIAREDTNIEQDAPKITLSIEDGAAEHDLPSRTYFLTVNPITHMDGDTPQTTLHRIASRIDFLLNNKPASLNATAAASGKNLRCRLLIQESALRVPDAVDRFYSKIMRYRVICDDETINT